MCSKEEAVDRWLHHPQPPRVHVDYTRPGFVRPEERDEAEGAER